MEPLGLVRREPAAPLRSLVSACYGYREETGSPMRRREGPRRGCGRHPRLRHRLVDRRRARPRRARRPLLGVCRRHARTAGADGARGASHGLQIDLSPHAARALFHIPMDSLARRVVPLEDLLGRRAPLLVEQLQELPDWAGRFAMLEATLSSWFADAPAPHREVA